LFADSISRREDIYQDEVYRQAFIKALAEAANR
jgi:hypothetical protein